MNSDKFNVPRGDDAVAIKKMNKIFYAAVAIGAIVIIYFFLS